jgi:hypothetical protein
MTLGRNQATTRNSLVEPCRFEAFWPVSAKWQINAELLRFRTILRLATAARLLLPVRCSLSEVVARDDPFFVPFMNRGDSWSCLTILRPPTIN